MDFKITHKIFFLSILLLTLSCKAQNCKDVSFQGKSYKDALKTIKHTNFNLSEKIYTNSSWIKSIEFYSCNEITGFLILTSKQDRQYIHNSVPLNLWYQFKQTDSYGRFYNANIKNKFQY